MARSDSSDGVTQEAQSSEGALCFVGHALTVLSPEQLGVKPESQPSEWLGGDYSEVFTRSQCIGQNYWDIRLVVWVPGVSSEVHTLRFSAIERQALSC